MRSPRCRSPRTDWTKPSGSLLPRDVWPPLEGGARLIGVTSERATASDPVVRRAWDQIDLDFDAHIEAIRRYLRLPTVSASGDDLMPGAEATAALIEAAGGTAEIISTPGHPAVLGRIDAPGPRLLRYGMYDVQPAAEPDWTTPAFDAAIAEVPGVGPSIVARGAANSKACLAAFLLALASALKTGDLPAGVTLLIDGEEELGSPHLPAIFGERCDDLAADAAGRAKCPSDNLLRAWPPPTIPLPLR